MFWRLRVRSVLVCVFVFLAFLVRLHRLDVLPFRGDEAFTVQNWVGLPLSLSLVNIATIEPHPVLTYVMFRVWGLLAGTSELTIRLLPALFGVLGVSVVYRLAWLLGRRVWAGVLAAGLWIMHPYLVWHAQDARNYSVWLSLSLLAFWLGLLALERRSWRLWLLYSVVCVFAVNVFYLEVFFLLSFGVWLFVARLPFGLAVRWFLSQVLPAFLAMVSFGLLQWSVVVTGQYGGTVGSSDGLVDVVLRFLPVLVFGETLWVSSGSVFLMVASGVVVFWVLGRWLGRAGFLLVFQVVVPVILLVFVSFWLDVFAPKYVLPVSAYLLLALSLFAVLVWECSGGFLRWFGVVLVGLWVIGAILSLWQMWFSSDYAKSPAWPDVSLYLSTHVDCNDLVIQLSADAAFGYYYDACAPDIALPASPQQPKLEILDTLANAADRHTSLWIVGQTFPDWPNAGIVEEWLREHLQQVRTTTLNNLRVEQFMPWQVKPTQQAQVDPITFGDFVQLVGWHVWMPPEPDGHLLVWLYWQPLNPTDRAYKVFVHIVGDVNPATGTPLWSQHDQYPQNGRISTQDWTPAAIYRDVYTLPLAGVIAGDYRINVGWYDPDTLQRVLINDRTDSYAVAHITLP